MEDPINLPFLLVLKQGTSEAALREVIKVERVELKKISLIQKDCLYALIMVEIQEYHLADTLYNVLAQSMLVEEIL